MTPVKTKFLTEDTKLVVAREQDVEDLIRENRHLADEGAKHYGHARWRLAARVPAVVIEQWMMECGAALGSKEFIAYCKKKMKDGEFAAFKVKGF